MVANICLPAADSWGAVVVERLTATRPIAVVRAGAGWPVHRILAPVTLRPCDDDGTMLRPTVTERSPVEIPVRPRYGRHGAVVSPHGLASQAGIGVLRAGGNAVDAAVATNAALAVLAPHGCGLGGDAFWLIWDGIELHGLNGSGRSGHAATLDAARAANGERLPVRGPWSVTVPGAVRSWGDAHARFGRLPWKALLEPALELAAGFPASWYWVGAVERALALFGADSEWARAYRGHARPWRLGEIVVIPGLAGTLRHLAQEGPDTTYTGALADRASHYFASHGVPIDGRDLADHTSTWTTPLRTTYRDVQATSHPPNSCGTVAIQLLNVLGRFPPPPSEAFDAHGVADDAWVHIGLEAARATLAERERWLTDADAMAPGTLEAMLGPGRAAEIAASIDPRRASSPSALDGPAGGGTIYLATADRWGGVVSLIESNYLGFGSGLVDPETGIGYQDRGAAFSLDPAHVNVLAPRKRTMHTLAPGMLFRDGQPWVAHGSMGGEIQPQIFAQVVSALVDGGVDVAMAVAAPRWAADVPEHHRPPSLTVVETRYHPAVVEGLRARGHDVVQRGDFDHGIGHAHAIEIMRDPAETAEEASRPAAAVPAGRASGAPSAFAAATDPRSDGAPAVW